MKFKEWKKWVSKLPWQKKWFIVLVFFRPLIDIFYFLKEISPFLSPLYITGILIPIIALISIKSGKMGSIKKIGIDNSFFVLSVFAFINIGIILMSHLSLNMFGNAVKYFTPFLLYFYLRRFVKGKKDLIGIFQSFLYSIFFTIIIIPYEYLFNPRAFESLSEARGAGIRFSGGFADIMNYAIYIVGGLLILCFYYLEKGSIKWKKERKQIALIIFFLISVAGLVAIKHTATWAVFLMILGFFFLVVVSGKQFQPILLILLMIFGILGQMIFESQINPLIKREVNVIEGKEISDRSFNGRMKRWRLVFREWNKMGLFSHVFGVSLVNFQEKDPLVLSGLAEFSGDKTPVMISGGMHSDFVRMLFMTGIIGLGVYLFFLLGVFKRVRFLDRSEKFLVTGAVLIVGLYSVSTNPLIYQALMNLILPIFAYSALPRRKWIVKRTSLTNAREYEKRKN